MSVTRPWDGKDADSRPDDGWFSVSTNEAAVPRTVFGYAVCTSTGARHYRYLRGKAKTLGGGEVAHVQVKCPSGAAAVSGGASITGAPDPVWLNTTTPEDTVVDSDAIPDNRWGAFVANGQVGVKEESARAYAVCKI
jgi:hypothetical protein